ncbi:PEGA domain-containing protein [Candidatus Uhrbacteria bacterium]|nr:PEGA domain-containing protein [Candidatus Uhrbacteria bacterium]
MTRKTRLAILTAFAVAFTVSVPLVVMKTAGYRYNWKKGRAEKTGIIKFVTEPKGADIRLNGQLQPRRTPMSVFRLLPEDYEIRLSLSGYHEWSKTLEVKSGITTFTEDVVMIRNSSPIPVRETDWSNGAWNPDGSAVAFLRPNRGAEELVVMEPPYDRETLLARLSPDRLRETALSWSPDGKRLMIQGDRKDGGARREATVHNVFQADTEPVTITGQEGTVARWSSDGRSVTVIDGGTVTVTDLNGGMPKPIPGTAGVQDALLASGRLLSIKTVDGHNELLEMSPNGSLPPKALTALPTGSWNLSVANGDFVFLADQRTGQGMAFRLSDGRLSGPWNGVTGVWNKTGNQERFLTWNDFEISIWDPETDTLSTIARISSPIRQCLWDPTGRNVIFSAGNSIFAAEIDGRDRRNTYELNRMTAVGPMAVVPKDRQIVFLGSAGQQQALYRQGF